jgi:predicted RecB family nuclease
MADPKAVAEKTGASENTVGKLQGRAQLSLIPGMKDKDLTLLEELDITDRKSLAAQDPIELGKKMNAIFKVNLARGKVSEADKPTIEEIDSWVKFVKS